MKHTTIYLILFFLIVAVLNPQISLAQDSRPCDSSQMVNEGEFPLSPVDSLTLSGEVYDDFSGNCGHIWYVTLSQPATLWINLIGQYDPDSHPDPYLYLYDLSNVLIESDNDSGGGYAGLDALITTDRLSSTTYQIITTDYDVIQNGNLSWFRYELVVTVKLEPQLEVTPPIFIDPPTNCSAATTNGLNLRSGPGTTYRVLDKLANGTPVIITGRISDQSWWRVEVNGLEGWLSAEFVQQLAACDAPVIEIATDEPPPTDPPPDNPPPPVNEQEHVEPILTDLTFRDVSNQLDSENRTVTVEFTVVNQGDATANNFVVKAQGNTNWNNSSLTLSLDVGAETRQIVVLEYPESEQGKSRQITLQITGELEIDYENNVHRVRVTIPASAAPSPPNAVVPNSEDSENNLALPIGIAVILGMVVFGGWRLRIAIKPPPPDAETRRYWEKRANQDSLESTCQQGIRCCRMEKPEPQFHLYEVKAIELIAQLQNGSGSKHREITGRYVEEINNALHIRRSKEEWETLRKHLIPTARLILEQIDQWLEHEQDVRQINLSGQLEGSEVEFEFTVYRCDGNQWKKEIAWNATITDKRTLPISLLEWKQSPSAPMRDQQARMLANGLVEMIKAI